MMTESAALLPALEIVFPTTMAGGAANFSAELGIYSKIKMTESAAV
jgi:hypothetical protein